MTPSLRLERMLIVRGTRTLYDEKFHSGINIIHGSNGSGKSTVADFIFFGLGGDLREWKAFASRAEFVMLQLVTPSGLLTTRRYVSSEANRPMDIYFGDMDEALGAARERWQNLSYKRPEHGYSFSQILFRAIGLPEAVSEGSSNITMHQILRLLYVDQLTPVQRIFRVESFDTWQTKQVIGDLLSGVGGYDLYDRQIQLRELIKQYDAAEAQFRSLVSIASGYGENILMEYISIEINNITEERKSLLTQISELVSNEDAEPSDEIKALRRAVIRDFNKARFRFNQLEDSIETLNFEIEDADNFISHLEQSLREFDDAASTFFSLGHVAFEFCPSCFTPVNIRPPEHCQLCGAVHQAGEGSSKALAVKLDLQMQLRESYALQVSRRDDVRAQSAELRVARTQLRRARASVELARSGGASGREAAISEMSRKIGFIDNELETLQKRMEIARRVQQASEVKEELNVRITRLRNEIESIVQQQGTRKGIAYTAISKHAKSLLDEDLSEHSDFGEISHVSFDFSGDWIAINGDKNRAGSASGMVVLKNSFAAGMLFSSLSDKSFNLPRWMLLDDIEDKGMVEERSWNFQRMLVARSRAAKSDHQIIFTTSKIAPELADTPYVVGRRYTREAPSLNKDG